MGDIWSDNPWAYQMEYFQHFCCPECDTKEKNREIFIRHALENHPKAINYLLIFELFSKDSNEVDFNPESTKNVIKLTKEEEEQLDWEDKHAMLPIYDDLFPLSSSVLKIDPGFQGDKELFSEVNDEELGEKVSDSLIENGDNSNESKAHQVQIHSFDSR